MIKLIRLWYRSRVVKYTALSTTRNQLQAKYEDDPGNLTLTEYGQLHYIGQEVLTIKRIAEMESPEELDDIVPKPPSSDGKDGMYL